MTIAIRIKRIKFFNGFANVIDVTSLTMNEVMKLKSADSGYEFVVDNGRVYLVMMEVRVKNEP